MNIQIIASLLPFTTITKASQSYLLNSDQGCKSQCRAEVKNTISWVRVGLNPCSATMILCKLLNLSGFPTYKIGIETVSTALRIVIRTK